MEYGVNIVVNGEDIKVEILAGENNQPSKKDIMGALELAKMEVFLQAELVELELVEYDFSEDSPLSKDLSKGEHEVGDVIQLPKEFIGKYLELVGDKRN